MNMKSQATPAVSHADSTPPHRFTHFHQKPTSHEVSERVESFTEVGGSWEGGTHRTVQQQALQKSHIEYSHVEKPSDTPALGVFMALNRGLLSRLSAPLSTLTFHCPEVSPPGDKKYMHLVFLWGTTSPLVVESLPTRLPLGPDSVPQVTLMSFANEEESWSREVRLHVIHLTTWDLERLS